MTAAEPSLFFVLGAPKSGTTWVEHALNAHPELVCKGEGKFHFFRDRLVEAAGAYNRFIKERNTKVFGAPTFPPLDLTEMDAVFSAFVETRMRAGGPWPGIRKIGVKDPDFGLYLADFAACFPHAAYLHIIRDPRDAVVSMWRHMQRVHPEVRLPPEDAFFRDTALGWRNYIEDVRAEVSKRGLSYLEITYEAMTADPAGTLAGAFRFLDVDGSEPTVLRCVAATRFETLSQGRSVGQEDRTSFFRRGLSGGWRDEITPDQAALILEAAGRAAQALGYVPVR